MRQIIDCRKRGPIGESGACRHYCRLTADTTSGNPNYVSRRAPELTGDGSDVGSSRWSKWWSGHRQGYFVWPLITGATIFSGGASVRAAVKIEEIIDFTQSTFVVWSLSLIGWPLEVVGAAASPASVTM